MNNIECGYVDYEWCRTNLEEKKVYIFGIGVDGEKAYNKLRGCIDVEGFLDNYRFGNKYYDKNVISIEQYVESKKENSVILLASYRYANEIVKTLNQNGLEIVQDFVVWDDMHILMPDDTCVKYCDFNKNIWQSKKIQSKNQILIPFDNRHDMDVAIYAYCANYLAEKYKSKILGFCRYGSNPKNASNVLLNIYKSINMESLISPELTGEQHKEVDCIFEKIWDKLYTWKDWKNITIYDINFGTTFITDYLRIKMPSYDLRDDSVADFVYEKIATVVFWYNYIKNNNVKAVLLADGVCWEGYIRDIAITFGIPAYAVQYTMQKAYLDFHDRTDAYQNYKKMWETLTSDEQEYGIKWAKKHVENRIKGDVEDIDVYNAMNFTFAKGERKDIKFSEKKKIGVVITPHIFEENSYQCGEHVFDNSYMSWLCHLGELSSRTPHYNWYIKMHPAARRRDPIIIQQLVERFPRIKMLPADISPKQLKKEGIKFALTICGTIGHEYPAIGIDVINAGLNPHSAFDFTWNPKSKDEYDDLILNLDKLEPKNNLDQLYAFYAMHYLYYDREYIDWKKIFFENEYLSMDKLQLEAFDKEYGTWKYDEYMKEWTHEKHKRVLSQIPEIFEKMDSWNPETFYRK